MKIKIKICPTLLFWELEWCDCYSG